MTSRFVKGNFQGVNIRYERRSHHRSIHIYIVSTPPPPHPVTICEYIRGIHDVFISRYAPTVSCCPMIKCNHIPVGVNVGRAGNKIYEETMKMFIILFQSRKYQERLI